MEQDKLLEYLDQTRWLCDNGFLTSDIKNTLYGYASIVHKDVKAIHLATDVGTKTLHYEIYVDNCLLKKINRYMADIVRYNITITKKSLSISDFLFIWRFKRFVKREGNLDFSQVLKRFVKDLLGDKWKVNVNVLNIEDFKEEKEELENSE